MIMLLAAGREVVSKTSAYNITKLSYRVEVRVMDIWICDMWWIWIQGYGKVNTTSKEQSHSSLKLIYWRL